MAGIDVFRKQINSSLFGQPVEMRAYEGWVQYRAEGSTEDWVNLFEIPVDGEDGTHGLDGANGLDGAPGIDGASVELRVYGDWVQWRQDDNDPTWTNLYAIDEAGGVPITPEKTPIEAMILLAETVLSANGEIDIDLTALGDLTGYVDLELYFEGTQTNSSYIHIFFNGDYTASNYRAYRRGATGSASNLPEATVFHSNHTANMKSTGRLYIARFQSSLYKTTEGTATYRSGATSNLEYYDTAVLWLNNAAINRITLRAYNHPTGQITAGSAIRLYGRKQVEVVTDLDGGRMFRGEKGETGQPGINGRDVEMQTIPDGEACQIIQWRHAGDSTWADLAHVPVCGSGEPTVTNVQMNRCGIAVALTEELHRLYVRVKEDPTVWDTLEGWATAVSLGTGTTAAIAGLVAHLVGGAIASGFAVYGAPIAAGSAFLGWLFNAANNGIDHWTLATTEHIRDALNCVLVRRETVTISVDVLREWVSFIADAPVSGDNDLLIGLVSVLPVQYWINEAVVAQPDINACIAPCVTRVGQWCTEIGTTFGESLAFDAPGVRATSSILVGRVTWDDPYHLRAVPTPLDTLLYSITLNFGRPVIVGGIDIGITYLQSVDTTSPAVIVTDNLGRDYGQLDVTGITGPFGAEASYRWRAFETTMLSSLTITGKVAVTDADSITNEMLRLDYIRLCGDGYSPYGESGNNCEGCDPYNPCIDGIDYGTDHCYTWDFTDSDGGWAGAGVYEAGVGWKSYLDTAPAYLRQDKINISKGGTNVNGRTVRRVEVDAMVTYGAIGGYAAAKYFTLSDVANGTTYLNRIDSFSGVEFDETDHAGNPLRSGLRLSAVVSSRNDISAAAPNPRGYVTVRRISIWYDGPDAGFTGGAGT